MTWISQNRWRLAAASASAAVVLVSMWAVTRYAYILFPNDAGGLGRLANVGQALSTASVVLTAVSLFVVGGALYFQIRGFRDQQEALQRTLIISQQESGAAQRGLHLQLIEYALNDQDLRAVLPPLHSDPTRARQYLYVNLMLSHSGEHAGREAGKRAWITIKGLYGSVARWVEFGRDTPLSELRLQPPKGPTAPTA